MSQSIPAFDDQFKLQGSWLSRQLFVCFALCDKEIVRLGKKYVCSSSAIKLSKCGQTFSDSFQELQSVRYPSWFLILVAPLEFTGLNQSNLNLCQFCVRDPPNLWFCPLSIRLCSLSVGGSWHFPHKHDERGF